MNIYYFFYPVIIILGLFFYHQKNSRHNRRVFIFIVLGLLTMESCLRGVSIGSDTENYYYMYKNTANISWNEIFNSFLSRYQRNDGTEDVGYTLFVKTTQLVSENFQFFLFITALFFFVPFGKLLDRYSQDMRQLTFTFIFYISLFNAVAMSGVRKEIALGMSIMAFLYYVDHKYLKMFAIIAIGMTIHMSILLFLLIPLLGLFHPRLLRLAHGGAFFLIPFVIVSSGAIIVFMGEAVDNDKYAEYGRHGTTGGAATFTFLIELLSFFCFWAFRKVDLAKDEVIGKLYITLPLFTFFAPLITNNGSMIRISQYFHIFLLVILPYAVEYSSKKNEGNIIYNAMMVVLMGLSIATNDSNYLFFWQDQYAGLFVGDYSF